MIPPPFRLFLLFAGVTLAHGEEPLVTFEKDVRPILKAHCTHCHGEEEKPKGGVDLRLRRFMDKALEGGAHVIVPGKPEESELLQLVKEGEMPEEGKKLTPEQIAVIEKWIAQGAKTLRPEPETLGPGTLITEEERAFWSFQPVVRPQVPQLEEASRVRNPIDAFILQSLRKASLDFAPDADKRALLRRVTLDLTGLLPTPEEVDAFLKDTSPQAYEKVVDRLLASPAYGERWARHWLDVAGYADSNGFAETDSVRPHAWRYRDYVIRSVNADKPWNEFITEQLAGDELAGVTHETTQQAVQDPAKRDRLIATGFLRMAPDGTGDRAPDPKLAQNQVIADEVKVVSSALLGLTVACAQCHDHRYDPIPHTDYFRFRAIFEPAYDWKAWRNPAQRLYSLYTPEERAKAAEIEKQAKAIEAEANAMNKKFLDEIFEKEVLKLPEAEREPYRAARAAAKKDRTPAQEALIKKYPSALALYSLDLYDKKLHQQVLDKRAEATKLRATKPQEEFVMALTERKGVLPKTHLFHRGDHDQPKQELTPGELTVLAGPQVEPFKPETVPSGSSGRRLAYARWLTSGKHPLVARVLVNRFWLNHFGRGIVNTPGDFGIQGERPTHPELLDWLASEFVAGGWKLKPLHKLMVTSTTYRQSSRNEESVKMDPEGKLYARFNLKRIEAETLRDAMITATGTLNREPFGPPISIARDSMGRVVVGRGEQKDVNTAPVVHSIGEAEFRRSIYLQVRRSLPVTVLDTFDAPTMVPNCEMRSSTTVAPQSLLMMNDTFVVDTSRKLAERLRKEAPGNARNQIARAWRILFGIEPQDAEVKRSLMYLAEQTETLRSHFASKPPAKNAPPVDVMLEALGSYCQVLFSSNRFLYIE